jgi:hypothetical protein
LRGRVFPLTIGELKLSSILFVIFRGIKCFQSVDDKRIKVLYSIIFRWNKLLQRFVRTHYYIMSCHTEPEVTLYLLDASWVHVIFGRERSRETGRGRVFD